MENLKLRLKIFKDSGMIDEKQEREIVEIIEYLKNKYTLNITDENSSMFITHLVMSLKRIKNKEYLKSLEDEELEEFKKEINYEKACKILDELEEKILKIKIPDNEIGYILAHLINLLGGIE